VVVVVGVVDSVVVPVDVWLVVGVDMAQAANVPSKYELIIAFINATESEHVLASFRKPPTVHVTSLSKGSAGEEYAKIEARRPD